MPIPARPGERPVSRQAVLLIHGIGRQRPMDTLRSFVEAVWSSDSSVHRNHALGATFWSKPYPLSQNFELRRLTTAENKAGIRTDFFEFYWAHMMQGTKVAHVVGWAKSLLLRPWASVPPALRAVYLLLWLLLVVVLVLSGISAYQAAAGHEQAWWFKWILGLIVVPALTMVLTDVIGDAARYLHVDPANVQCRHEIRAAGVQVLKSLHDKGYDRIVVVGHSLGSVIGYDILTHSWAEMSASEPAAGGRAIVALQRLEDMADKNNDNVQAWQSAQRAFLDLQRTAGCQWRVTDFITLGSPLAHAQVLLARNMDELSRRVAARELLACPPALERTMQDNRAWAGMSYPPGAAERKLQHAAVFACTRWTNLYFPCKALVVGDLVGGPIRGVFGLAIKDVAVKTNRWLGLLSHTLYWRPRAGDTHVDALRRALDLLDSGLPPPDTDAVPAGSPSAVQEPRAAGPGHSANKSRRPTPRRSRR